MRSDNSELVTTSDNVEIGDLEKQNTILISIPYRGVPRNEVANVSANLKVADSQGTDCGPVQQCQLPAVHLH